MVPGRASAGSSGPSDGHGARAQAEFTNAIQKWVKENTRLGIPVIFHEEALHGLMGPEATSFPQAIALASTWNPDLAERAFAAVAKEVRARGTQQVLAPVVDVARDPRWGRFEETFGEDPYLVARMGLAAVRGFQGGDRKIPADRVIATLKHMTGHGQPESGTNVGPANLGERTLRDVFFSPFEVAVKQGHARSLMPSYNEIDGIPSHANRWMLRDVLRNEWGFDGTIVSDWQAVSQLAERHRVAADDADAARQALAATVDVELPDVETYHTLVEQVKQKKVPEAAIDDAVRRLLREKFELGLFEDPFVDPDQRRRDLRLGGDPAAGPGGGPPGDRAPAEPGRAAPSERRQGAPGGGDRPARGRGDARRLLRRAAALGQHPGGHPQSAREGRHRRPRRGGAHHGGLGLHQGSPAARRGNPLASAVIGRQGGARRPGREPPAHRGGGGAGQATATWPSWWWGTTSRPRARRTPRTIWATGRTCGWSGSRRSWCRAVLDTRTPTVLVLINGRPPAIPELAERAPAILEGWYLGQEGGTALAEVLFGDVNPSGKLPVSFPRSVGQLPLFYNRKPTAMRGYLFDSTKPLFPFGHGLSYTTFSYSDPDSRRQRRSRRTGGPPCRSR